mmetsp:Transcript_27417/g.51174  ORF Transcript_27417/g.51174 Transcript_27417/m.51174 type:complete len:357 (-) Transcript_27417:842-1912(-)
MKTRRSAYLRHLRPTVSFAFINVKDIRAALFPELSELGKTKLRGFHGLKIPISRDIACRMATELLDLTKKKEEKHHEDDPERMLVMVAIRGFNHVESLDIWHVVTVVAVKIGHSRTVIRFSNDYEVAEHVVMEYKRQENRGRKSKHPPLAKFVCNLIAECTAKREPPYIASGCGKNKEGLDPETDPLRVMSANIHNTAATLKAALDVALAQSQAYTQHEVGRNIATGMFKDLELQIAYTTAYFGELKSNKAWGKLRTEPLLNRFLIRDASPKYRAWAKLKGPGQYWLISICDQEKDSVKMESYSVWNIPILGKTNSGTGKKSFFHGSLTGEKGASCTYTFNNIFAVINAIFSGRKR